LVSESHEGDEDKYHLHEVHSDYLVVDALYYSELKQTAPRQSKLTVTSPLLRQTKAVGGRIQRTASTSSMATSQASQQQTQSGSGKSVVQAAAQRLVKRLTSVELQQTQEKRGLHSSLFDYSCWKRLLLLSELGLCSEVSPAECFQAHIDHEMATCNAGNMLSYIAYACHMLEQLNIYHPILDLWYRTSLDFLERAGKAECAETALVLNNLGVLYQKQRRYSDAVDLHFKAAVILEAQYGARSLNVASTYVHIGLSLILMKSPKAGGQIGDVGDALHMFRKALVIATDLASLEDSRIARYLCSLSALLAQHGLQMEAVTGYTIATAIFEKVFGKTHPETIITRGEKGIALLVAGDADHGNFILDECIASFRSIGCCENDRKLLRLKQFRLTLSRAGENDDTRSSTAFACVC